MARADFAHMHCSIARSLDVIGDPWTPLVLRDLFLGVDRFDDLVTDLGISRNLLTQRLKRLTDAGVVVRQAYQNNPPRYTYRLTQAGFELAPLLMALVAWGDRWATPEGGPPIRFRHSCGEVTTPVMTCPACGEPMSGENVTPLPGPGARVAPGTRLLGAFTAPDEPESEPPQ